MQYCDSTKAVLVALLGAVLVQYWAIMDQYYGGQYWDSTKAVLVQYWGAVLGAVLDQY